MTYIAILFLAFSMSISYVAGDKAKEVLSDKLSESTYKNTTMVEQVRQSQVKAARDASKMGDLATKLNKLSTSKKLVERRLQRTKRRRTKLLRPQIAKIKERVEAPLKAKLSTLEQEVKTTKVDLAKLKADNDRLRRRYNKLRKRIIKKEGRSSFENLLSPNQTPLTIEDLSPDETPLTIEDLSPDETPLTKDAPVDDKVTPSGDLVRLENGTNPEGSALINTEISNTANIPASEDLISEEEILKSADRVIDQLPDYLSVEKIKLKEGWL